MTRAEELTVLAGVFGCVLLMWTPVFIDIYRQEKKLDKRKRGK
jgi:hypothetical protein